MSKIWVKIKTFFKDIVLPVFTNIAWTEIPVSTYVRWIIAIILSINTVLTTLGLNPIPYSETDIYEIVSVILNVIILIINTYKNNSTSKEALIADKIMKALKIASTSNENTAIGKLQDILTELNEDEKSKDTNNTSLK